MRYLKHYNNYKINETAIETDTDKEIDFNDNEIKLLSVKGYYNQKDKKFMFTSIRKYYDGSYGYGDDEDSRCSTIKNLVNICFDSFRDYGYNEDFPEEELYDLIYESTPDELARYIKYNFNLFSYIPANRMNQEMLKLLEDSYKEMGVLQLSHVNYLWKKNILSIEQAQVHFKDLRVHDDKLYFHISANSDISEIYQNGDIFEKILKDEIYDIEYVSYSNDISDVDYVTINNQNLNTIFNSYLKLDSDEIEYISESLGIDNNIESVKQYIQKNNLGGLKEIFKLDYLDSLKDEIMSAYYDASNSTAVDNMYNGVLEPFKQFFGNVINDERFIIEIPDEIMNFYQADTYQNGNSVEDIVKSYFDEDYYYENYINNTSVPDKLKDGEPYYGWDSSPDDDTFNTCLHNRL